MSSFTSWRKAIALAALVALVGAGSAVAQLQSGNLYGTVQDNQGAPLPGVTVTLQGVGATQVQVTNAEGQYRFLGLAPGSWSVKAELEGFSTVDYPNITIAVGRNTSIEMTLTPAVEEVITVTSESPLLDERRISTGTTVTQTELEKIPTARDPWVILQQTPGVLVDRVNVGGNESGQQSVYVSPGTNDDNSVWAVDGVVITDMGAIGSSPSYYNFDSFEEMQVTTGGTDSSLATGGVTMNMVTKRGTNEWRFSGRYLLTDDSWQSDFDFDQNDLGAGQPTFQQGNAIVKIEDYGAEGGGPIVKDRLWIWGSYGVQDINLLTLRGVQGLGGPGSNDITELESYAAKINAQVTSNNSLTAFYHFGDKIKTGRNAGPERPAPTTWNQVGPTDIYKLEDTHIFNSNFYLTGMASYVGGGFSLTPAAGGIGDTAFPNVTRLPNRVWQNSFTSYATERPQEQAKLDGNYFFNVGSSSHELRFGVGYRNALVESFSTWPGQQLVGLANIRLGTQTYLGFNRTDRDVSDEVDYYNLYVQDTLTLGNLVANFGIRYDLQEGQSNASTIKAPPVTFRDRNGNPVQAGGTFAGSDPGFEWEDITPRLGLTYALGEDRKTLLRMSYSRFADQLSTAIVSNTNPANYQYGYFRWEDRNNDFQLTADEVGRYIGYAGFDPDNPGLVLLNTTDPNLEAPITDELVATVEHALLPEFVVGLTATFRRYTGIVETERIVIPDGGVARPHRRDDYRQLDTDPDVAGTQNLTGRLPNGQTYNQPVYTLKDGLTFLGGVHQENSDRDQNYTGVSLTFNKRLANRWLLRGFVNWSDWTWDVPDSEREDLTRARDGSSDDGGAVLLRSTGSGAKGNVYINSNWSFDLSGMYQIAPDRPWGFNLAANINGREGYPNPYHHEADFDDGLNTRQVALVSDVEDFRNDDVITFNARVEKEITFSDWNLTLSVDGFNLTNESTVLQRNTTFNQASGDFVREIISPRVFRVGARVSFR